jgi:hypothetical protein
MWEDTRTPLTRRERRRGGIEFWACMKALYIFLERVRLDWPLEQSTPAVFLLPPYIPPYYEENGNISIPNSTSLGYNPTNPDLDALGVGYISIYILVDSIKAIISP